jgi:DNA-binding LacI/PurR family transcriptional regulator
VTSVDVARHAGVSQSVVSRVFSRGPTQSGVSEAMRKRVLAAAAELGYRPNALARSLITRRSRIVALLFSYLDNQFYALALEKLCIGLQAEGYHALVFMMPSTDEGVEETVSQLMEYQVDGIITASVELSSRLAEYCHTGGIPVVMFNRVQDDDRLSSVTTDNVAGGRIAARHFVAAGHRRIALLAGWERASTNRDREFGFAAELAAAGVPLFARDVGHFHLERTEEATLRLFAPDVARPDALFVTNDYMALRVLSVLRFALGLRVPDDVAVIGFDDVPLAAMPEFALTTLRQPLERMVSNAIRVLLDQIARPEAEAEHLALAPQLVERASTTVRCRRPGSEQRARAAAAED